MHNYMVYNYYLDLHAYLPINVIKRLILERNQLEILFPQKEFYFMCIFTCNIYLFIAVSFIIHANIMHQSK